MQPTINVDLSKALLRFGEAGIPEQVRTNLRRLIPPLAINFTAQVNNRLNTQLKSRNSLTVTNEMRENRNQITAKIQIVSSTNQLLPTYLELGTRPHGIDPVNAQFLHFALGGVIEVFAKHVEHPGTRAYHFLEDTLVEFKSEILDTMQQATQGL
jgi:hypothetical protein